MWYFLGWRLWTKRQKDECFETFIRYSNSLKRVYFVRLKMLHYLHNVSLTCTNVLTARLLVLLMRSVEFLFLATKRVKVNISKLCFLIVELQKYAHKWGTIVANLLIFFSQSKTACQSLLILFYKQHILKKKTSWTFLILYSRWQRGIPRPSILEVPDLFSPLDSSRNRFYHSSDPRILAKISWGPWKL